MKAIIDYLRDGCLLGWRATKYLFGLLALPCLGIATVLVLWAILSASVAKELPSPLKTWEESKLYVLHPFTKRGELDQGIGLFTWLSLQMVLKGYFLALVVGTPLGFLLGSSKIFHCKVRNHRMPK